MAKKRIQKQMVNGRPAIVFDLLNRPPREVLEQMIVSAQTTEQHLVVNRYLDDIHTHFESMNNFLELSKQ